MSYMDERIAKARIELQQFPEKTYNILKELWELRPKDKPPLLNNKEMHAVIGAIYDLSHDKVAQAQREEDIKFYEGSK